MSMSIITLTTDFGLCDSYVAQMKGVILAINPQVQLVDVTHSIGPQDVARGAAIVEEIAMVFPVGSIHLAVVDPGVGSDRALVAAEVAGQRFLAPDNGLLSPVFRRFAPARIRQLANERYWRNPVSATFHGRDILAPVAAHWSLGVDPAEFGPAVDVASLVTLPPDEIRRVGTALFARVEVIDAFGNLITNVRDSDLPVRDRATVKISLGKHQVIGVKHCYSDEPPGGVLALIGSSGRLEIAVNNGNAAQTLGVALGAEVCIESPCS
jgi:S-adenosylmethionine hydrolase